MAFAPSGAVFSLMSVGWMSSDLTELLCDFSRAFKLKVHIIFLHERRVYAGTGDRTTVRARENQAWSSLSSSARLNTQEERSLVGFFPSVI